MRALSILLLVWAGVTAGGAAESWNDFARKPDEWWAGADAREIGANILTWQSAEGSWPKNTDTHSAPFKGDRPKLQGTFDNSATTRELRFLARLFSATHEDRFREAFLRGYRHILQAQYPNGGWPQYYPAPAGSYHRHITFNDNAMVRLMEFLRETTRQPLYSFVDADLRQRAGEAFDRGVQCILRCQVRVNGELTVWCAQHDEVTLQPASARTYELVSLSGAESADIVELLMSLEHPGAEVLAAVDAAVRWFEKARLNGIKEVREKDANSPKGWNKVIVRDESAPPLWARFYEIETTRPIFVDRDGIPKYELSQIGYERRNGYAWLGSWPSDLLKKYPAWRKAHAG